MNFIQKYGVLLGALTVVVLLMKCSPESKKEAPQSRVYKKDYKVRKFVEVPLLGDEGRTAQVYEYVIDSCTYFGRINSSSGDYLAHKGNCTNHK